MTEYLHTLQQRHKWQKSKPNPYVGEIVLLTDEIVPRDQWKIGRIESIEQGDGPKRKAVVKTTNGKTYERHVTKLISLELD